jgi:DNA (cytosine-5)-methyltransferase 1
MSIVKHENEINKTIRYIDLCSGIGGFRVALESIETIKTHCVLSADIKQDAIDTYNINFNENNVKKDIYVKE